MVGVDTDERGEGTTKRGGRWRENRILIFGIILPVMQGNYVNRCVLFASGILVYMYMQRCLDIDLLEIMPTG
jgi:hypothetical protein